MPPPISRPAILQTMARPGPTRTIEDDPSGHFCYIAVHPLDDGTVLLGYCAYSGLAHSRVVKIPVDWFYSKH
jgi:hypothetical protein